MRVALFADIHGNVAALERVLEDIDANKPDHMVCLGDVALTGPQPGQVVERLRTLDCRFVMGNADSWALDPHPWKTPNEDSRILLDIELWGAQQLSSDDRDFLRAFQPTVELSLGGGGRLHCYHGSPRSNTELIEPTTADDELDSIFAGIDAVVMAGGHIHRQMLRRYRDGFIVNPGSVGLPITVTRDGMRNPPWAEYALLHIDGDVLGVEFRRVPFDARLVVQAALSSGMPHADRWARDWG